MNLNRVLVMAAAVLSVAYFFGCPDKPGEPEPDILPFFAFSTAVTGLPLPNVRISSPAPNPRSESDIQVFELSLETGALTSRGTARSGPSPNYMAFHPSGRYLYAISEAMGQPGRIFAFASNAAPVPLSPAPNMTIRLPMLQQG